jgi:branched-chain amino acid transport system ATP-binding protein
VIRSFQISAVFPHLTLMENVRIGLQRKLGTAFHFWRSERSLRQLDAAPWSCSPKWAWKTWPTNSR